MAHLNEQPTNIWVVPFDATEYDQIERWFLWKTTSRCYTVSKENDPEKYCQRFKVNRKRMAFAGGKVYLIRSDAALGVQRNVEDKITDAKDDIARAQRRLAKWEQQLYDLKYKKDWTYKS